MKLSLFRKLIREVIREELDFKFAAVEKKLDEVLVSNKSTHINEARTQEPVSTGFKKLMNETGVKKSFTPKPKSNISTPNTNNSILNSLLQETAESDDWKSVQGSGQEVQSVQDNTEALPNHLAEALTKDYSEMLDVANKKAKFKNGA